MAVAMLLAVGLALGAPWWLPLLVGASLVSPWSGVVVASAAAGAGWIVGRRRPPGAEERVFLQGVAYELRGGASLRAALAAAADRTPSLDLRRMLRLMAAGRPLVEVAVEVRRGLPRHGLMTAAAIRVAADTGGRSADVFEGIALLAAEDDDLTRERRAATAHARASAAVVGGIPVALLMAGAFSGRLPEIIGGRPLVAGLGAAGLSLVLMGSATVWYLLRRSGR